MASRISVDTAQKISAAWMQALKENQQGAGHTLESVMRSVGLKAAKRNLDSYRRLTEQMLEISLPSLNPKTGLYNVPRTAGHFSKEYSYDVLVFSDAHFGWGETSRAYDIFLELLRDVQPEVVLDLGDSLDCAALKRHAPTMWENVPTFADELEDAQKHIGWIEEEAGKATLLKVLGNHDLNFERYLATHAPQIEGLKFTTISEYFPQWDHKFVWLFNDTLKAIHTQAGGQYSAKNATLRTGISVIQGHLHFADIFFLDDYRGRRAGIQAPTLAETDSSAFYYMFQRWVGWQSGCVFVHIDGDRVYPELILLEEDGTAKWRGKRYGVSVS